jgi:hypothetical protein
MMDAPHNPELLRDALFKRCKKYWAAGLSVNVMVFCLGTFVIFGPDSARWVALVALAFKVIAEGLLWYSDHWKGLAQSLHRKLDLENAFGWAITKSELADFLARYTGKLDSLAGTRRGTYFASTEEAGVNRAIQNVRESSWWSMHLSQSMGWVFSLLIVCLFVGCTLLLNASVHTLPQTAVDPAGEGATEVVTSAVVKIVTSVMMLVFSLGLLRLACGYFGFSSKSKQIREKAEAMLDNGPVNEIQAIKLWQEYHLARAGAPILPDWIWRLREKKLNALWLSYMRE